eukprot:CAMPEP_0197825550 /NCGR_PEP_ID=MMETSP1437-20131217/2602_1 /TAXON_ID=49252 ORGANISM="Eucampia antarctica, Strain CCMP1452" /NCGR_SAMPLE_ID=MMETSP1437 /ASSEMBLY_ACC=CAM_ASM_001096 /LENGTH=118 /DNA_ID=CAMNT_0043425577 /DNA_START=46 /DNA_END=402 /DNA_ORIENTATION=+
MTCRNDCIMLLLIALVSTLMVGVQCFAPPQAFMAGRNRVGGVTTGITSNKDAMFMSSGSSIQVAVDGIDPTVALTQILGNFLGSPAVLAIPILAAFSVASVIAWFIVSYANPADPDED